MGNWTEIRLVEPNPNRNAVGAHIAVKTGTRTQMRTVEIGGGDASGHAGWVHVGLGTAERAEIRVQWPDGEWSYPYRVFANQFVVVDRDEAAGGILVCGALVPPLAKAIAGSPWRPSTVRRGVATPRSTHSFAPS